MPHVKSDFSESDQSRYSEESVFHQKRRAASSLLGFGIFFFIKGVPEQRLSSSGLLIHGIDEPEYLFGKKFKVFHVSFENGHHDFRIDPGIIMDNDVSKFRHFYHRFLGGIGNDAFFM
jgi:hypothetical protein